MPPTTDYTVTLVVTATVGIFMSLSGLLLVCFRRGRLRLYNIYIVFSLAALGFVRFGEAIATGQAFTREALAVWANLAVGSVIGLVGMLEIAKTDPPVWQGQARRR